MSARAFIGFVLFWIVLWLGLFLVAMANAQPTMQDILDAALQCPSQECPPAPPPSICGSPLWRITMRQVASAPADSWIETEIECGELVVDRTLTGCLRAKASNVNPAGSSPITDLAYGGEDCLPLPEPGLGSGLAVGSLFLGCLVRASGRRA